jgi:hypothetical protein
VLVFVSFFTQQALTSERPTLETISKALVWVVNFQVESRVQFEQHRTQAIHDWRRLNDTIHARAFVQGHILSVHGVTYERTKVAKTFFSAFVRQKIPSMAWFFILEPEMMQLIDSKCVLSM